MFKLRIEKKASLRIVAIESGSDGELKDMVGTKSEVDIFKIVKVANKTSGRDNEKKSESDLRDDEELAKTALAGGG